jgi:hypothetical protein
MIHVHIKRPLLMGLLFLLAIPSLAHATTLQDLFNGATLDVGSVRFDSWSLLSVDALVPPNPDFAQIDVLPIDDDPLNPGLEFVANGQLSTNDLDSIDLLFSFRVSSLSGDRFGGHNLTLTDHDFGGTSGIIFISSELTDGGGDPLASSLVIADKGSDFFLLSAGSGFASQAELDVTLDVFVTGFSSADSVSLISFTQRFSLVPEPTTFVLLLAACGLAERLFKRTSRYPG